MSRRNRFYYRYIKRHKKDYNTKKCSYRNGAVWKKYNIKKVQYEKSTTLKNINCHNGILKMCTRIVRYRAQTDNGPSVDRPIHNGSPFDERIARKLI